MRRLRVLIEHLPPNGARARALKGNSWTDDTHLTAIVADRVAEVGAGIVRALGGKASRPKPLPRPTDPARRTGSRGGHSSADVIAYLDSLKPVT